MNRNDLAVAPSYSSSYGASGNGERTLPPRSPRRSFSASPSPRSSSASPSPSGRPKKGVSSLMGPGGTSGGLAAPLLEGQSVHMALPSFHARAGTRSAGWKCVGCSHENLSALSNECSVCGMMRSISVHSGAAISESSGGDSNYSFEYDGNNSENSLSLHNSFSAVDPNLGDEIAHSHYSFGHGSLPVVLNSSMSTLNARSSSAFNSSFSSVPAQTSGRSSRNNRNAARLANRLRGRTGRFEEEEGHSSVRSFNEWSGNEKIKSWQCPTCTFVNESVLQLACEMCGHLRDAAGQTTGDTTAQMTPPTLAVTHVPTAAAVGSTSDGYNDDKNKGDDEWIHQLQKEQIREIISMQHEIFGCLDDATASGVEGSAFETAELEREIGQIQAELSNHTATQHSISVASLEHNDFEGDDDAEDDEERLEALLANQIQIMKEFQQGRDAATSPRSILKPAAGQGYSPGSRTSSSSRTSPRVADPLFGGSSANTAPKLNKKVSLRESMQAAGGNLRIEDICVPLLWGENLPSSSKQVSGGKITP